MNGEANTMPFATAANLIFIKRVLICIRECARARRRCVTFKKRILWAL